MRKLAELLCGAALVAAAGLFAAGCTQEEGTARGAPRANAQTTCPVMGGKISKEVFADHDGKRVYFCCAGCIDEFEKDPAKYVKKLEDAGVVLDTTPAPRRGG